MATANVIQIIASFIGGTVVTAGILKATASNDIETILHLHQM